MHFFLNPLSQKVAADGNAWGQGCHNWRVLNYTPSLSIAKQCIVGLSAFTAGHKPSFVMEILNSAETVWRHFHLYPSLTGWYLVPLSLSYPLSPRGMIIAAVSSLECWASVREGWWASTFTWPLYMKPKWEQTSIVCQFSPALLLINWPCL